MYTCNFCKREDFPSRQSFNAHCRWCALYLQHKQQQAALGTSLRDAVPKAQPHPTPASPIAPPPPLPPPSDPLAPFKIALQALEQSQTNPGDTQETPQQRRRRVLQAAKSYARDHCWSFLGTVTAEMRAAGTLAIERELRNEPIEDWPTQEVNDFAAGVRDRVYTSFLRRQEKEARRTREADEHRRANQWNEERTQTACRKKKAAFIDEAQRRLVTCFNTRGLSPRQRIKALADVLAQLDEFLTGAEPLSEGYAAIDAVLQARVAEWDAYEAAKEAKRQEEWWDIATVVVVIIALGYMYIKTPEMLQWLLKILYPEPAEDSASTQTSTPEPPSHDESNPQRPIRRVRRRSQSPVPESPITS